RALKFYSSVRVEVRKGEALKQGTDIIGNKVNVKIVKNKVAPPFKSCTIEIRYGEGISKLAETLDLAVEFGLIDKSGAWFAYQGEKIGQGRDNVRGFLQQHPEIVETLDAQIKQKLTRTEEEA
ncbi:MAG: DNA recombination/repair protein RecA, partial [Erysipelotrichaceae bacterium]|nr:DNA recombination/repair protein RecA [Erysipelotrichaceae bacterium]